MEPLKYHCTWQIGGPADYFVQPHSNEEVQAVRQICLDHHVPFLVIGRGSNLLFDDSGVRGVVMALGSDFTRCAIDGELLSAQAGCWAPALARRTASAGLSGLEHLVGIPGNLGGLLYMNGGSLRHSIAESVLTVSLLDEENQFVTMAASDCGFSYRSSAFQSRNVVLLGAELRLDQSNSSEVRCAMLDILAERKQKFPLKLPNCGSVFSNDEELYTRFGPPGRLIDEVGLKGTRVGDVQISHQHGNFLVNLGQGTCQDVLTLIQSIRTSMYDRTGLWLTCEVRYVSPDGQICQAHKKAQTLAASRP